MMIRIESGEYLDTATGTWYQFVHPEIVSVTDRDTGATIVTVKGEPARHLQTQIRARHEQDGGVR